tara:strand:+ start:1441 stop:2760 length:1320 start_codon:yes stop_codon:yes gene_type:complete
MKDNIFVRVLDFCRRNYILDVEDKVPVFLSSIGAHMFNSVNKCSMCDFAPREGEGEDSRRFVIADCPLRHDNYPVYTPSSRIADTRIHILMRGAKGSGKNVLLDLFCAEYTGLLWNPDGFDGVGFRTMNGPNSVTEAGMFGSVNENGEIVGRPLARDLCGGFLTFEEFSSVSDANRKDHSIDMKNQMLTSLDSGRVAKGMRDGWVKYNTRYTVWGGTQHGRMDLESGLDRRFFIIDIIMDAEKEAQYKQAQNKQASMPPEERAYLAGEIMDLRAWFIDRQMDIVLNPPTGLSFDEGFEHWVMKESVRSFESDLFRRMAIGYHMMLGEWQGGVLQITLTEELEELLETSLRQRRNVMDEDVHLIKTTFWDKDVPRSGLVKDIARLITNNDYQASKRWIDDNLKQQIWFKEFSPRKEGRGRRGVVCRFGMPEDNLKWGEGK